MAGVLLYISLLSVLLEQVMAYSTGCGTPLSNFEAGLNYKDVQDPSVMVNASIASLEEKTYLMGLTMVQSAAMHPLAIIYNPLSTFCFSNS